GERHGWTIRNIMALDRGLREKERMHQEKYNPYHKQAGSPNGTGGEFDFAPGGRSGGGGGGRGRFSVRKPSKNPLWHRVSDTDGDGIEDLRPKNPMNPAVGPNAAGRGNVGGLT